MKHLYTLLLCATFALYANADQYVTASPDGRTVVTLSDDTGRVTYKVNYDSKVIMEESMLGIHTSIENFIANLKLTDKQTFKVEDSYTLDRSKFSSISYEANCIVLTYITKRNHRFSIEFQVSNNNVAFRYSFPTQEEGEIRIARIYGEASSFKLPANTTTFLTPLSQAMTGWKACQPSYEEEYVADAPLSAKSKYGEGFTFPCLFHVGDDGWALVSETGVGGGYYGSHLSEWSNNNGYTVTIPQEAENNGFGSSTGSIALPGNTPWRTITVGSSLNPIVETTIPFDVVKPLYKRNYEFRAGRYVWSWLIWQDKSINYDDQKEFIDLAKNMGYEYTLIDANWDTNIGYERIEDLSRYAMAKGVGIMLWYNSNGAENNAPQTPINIMDNAIARKKEMKWMKQCGIKGIKVDFFGGDKQETMRLYQDILSDANDYGLSVIFHGATIPRGWERMYPNFIASEAAVASENVYFTDHHSRREGFEMTMHPFCRNAIGSFDWGGVIMNRFMSKDNMSRHPRYTGDIFEIATAVTNQVAICCVEITPESYLTLPDFELALLKNIPSGQCDETRFLSGYPTRYFCVARRYGEKWYVAGINGTQQPITTTLELKELSGRNLLLSYDKEKKDSLTLPVAEQKQVKISKEGKLKVTLQPMGGFVIFP